MVVVRSRRRSPACRFDAIAKCRSDKPDLRCGMPIRTSGSSSRELRVFREIVANGGAVRGLS